MRSLAALIALMLMVAAASPALSAQEAWEGVDKAVMEKLAEEKGRPAKNTPLNSLEGDALLFAFLLGGAAGGFAAGYYYRKLTERGKEG